MFFVHLLLCRCVVRVGGTMKKKHKYLGCFWPLIFLIKVASYVINHLVEEMLKLHEVLLVHVFQRAPGVRGGWAAGGFAICNPYYNLQLWRNVSSPASEKIRFQNLLFLKTQTKKFQIYNTKIKMCGKKLPLCKHINYLGIYIDENLSWKYHQEQLHTKLKRAHNLLSIVIMYQNNPY